MIISNSEVEAYQKCERLHWFAYGLNLTPTEHSMPIKCGIMGHAVLEAYYRSRMNLQSHDECIQAGLAVIADYMVRHGEYYSARIIPIVTNRFLQYAKLYEHEPWEILDVEGVYIIPLANGIEYALTLDLLIKWTSGEYKGLQSVVDHKWVYNFWTADEVHMMAQIPKYLWGLQRLGSQASFGIVNQIRYRDMKGEPDDLFKRSRIEPTQKRLENIANIQRRAAQRIVEAKGSTWESEAIPSISKQNCRNCFFRLPCSIEIDGRDPTLTLAVNYIRNTYGYSGS